MMWLSWCRAMCVVVVSMFAVSYACTPQETKDEKADVKDGGDAKDAGDGKEPTVRSEPAAGDGGAKPEPGPAEKVAEKPTETAPDKGKTSLLKDVQQGDPKLRSIHRLAFLPGGILLVGDGVGDRIVAIETGDDDPKEAASNDFSTITNFGGKMVAAIGGGVTGSDLRLQHLAVNPISRRVYASLRRVSTNEHLILWMNGKGEFKLFDTKDVRYVSITYPAMGSAGSIVAQVKYIDGYVIASTMKGQWNPSQIVAIPTPLTHADSAKVSRTRSYHRAHRAWETEAPIDTFFAFKNGDKVQIGATFTCAPVVRFDIGSVVSGSRQVVGQTPFDYGPGQQVTGFVHYEKGGEKYLLATISNFSRVVRAVRVKHSLLVQSGQIDTQAPIILDRSFNPVHADATRAAAFDGVQLLTPYSDAKALVIKGSNIQTLPLP